MKIKESIDTSLTANRERAVRRLRSFCTGGLLVLVVVLGGATPARATSAVDLLISGNETYYQRVSMALAAHLRRDFPGVEVRVLSLRAGEPTPLAEGSLIVSVGTSASLKAAMAYPDRPQLSLVITRAAWQSLPGDVEMSHKATIFMDQPVTRLVALARAVAPAATNYGTVYGPVSGDQADTLARATARAGVRLRTTTIDRGDNPLSALTPVMRASDLFIAVPDRDDFNRNVGKWTLRLAFKQKVPVIGFSHAYTEAGAVASLFTSVADISRQGAEWLSNYLKDNRFDGWHSYPPSYFTITVNPSVARSLDLGKLEVNTLQHDVNKYLGESGYE